jgi:protein-disulfide isomerase
MSDLIVPVGPADHIEGPMDAPVTLVEYGDYQCSYCGEAYGIVKRLEDRLSGHFRFVFRNFPLTRMHPQARAAADLAEAAGLQGKFWQMHDRLYENQDALDAPDLVRYARELHLDEAKLQTSFGEADRHVLADYEGGERSGVQGTPTFFINGTAFAGDWTNADFFADAIMQAVGSKSGS